MHFNLFIPVFPVRWTEYYLYVFCFKERVSFWSRFPTCPYFCFVGSVKPLLPPFPQSQFPSWCFIHVTEILFLGDILKICPCCPPITVIQTLLTSGYCNTSFGPRSPLSPAKANFHCPLSSLFSICVNSVPPLMSASNSQLFFPVTSGALSTVLYQCCRKPAPSLHSLYMSMTQHKKKQDRMFSGLCFLIQLLAISTWFFF